MVNTSVVPSVVLALRTSFNSSPSFFMNSSTCGEREREGGRERQKEGECYTHTRCRHTKGISVAPYSLDSQVYVSNCMYSGT